MTEFLLFMLAPMMVGVLFGLFVQRQEWPYLPLLITAPLVSAIGIFILVYLLTISDLIINSQGRNQNPIYQQALGGVTLVTPAIFIYSAFPSVVGYLFSLILRK